MRYRKKKLKFPDSFVIILWCSTKVKTQTLNFIIGKERGFLTTFAIRQTKMNKISKSKQVTTYRTNYREQKGTKKIFGHM